MWFETRHDTTLAAAAVVRRRFVGDGWDGFGRLLSVVLSMYIGGLAFHYWLLGRLKT